MTKGAGSFAIIALAFILQLAVAPQLVFFGVTPNIVFVLVTTIALLQGQRQGAVIGFVTGLIFDLVGSGPIGVSALTFCVAGAIAGALRPSALAESWKLPMVIVMVSSFLAESLYAITLLLLGESLHIIPTLTDVVLPTAVYSGVIAAGIFPALAYFLRQDRPVQTFHRIGR